MPTVSGQTAEIILISSNKASLQGKSAENLVWKTNLITVIHSESRKSHPAPLLFYYSFH